MQRAAEMATRERARREFEEAKRLEREAIARARREAAAEEEARGAMAREDADSRQVRPCAVKNQSKSFNCIKKNNPQQDVG